MPLTDVRFADGKVQNYIEYEGQRRMYEEKPEQVFPTLRLTDGKLTGAQLIGTDVYYTFSEIGQAYIPAWSLQQDWLNRYGRLWTLTGVRLASDGVDYEIDDAGRPDTKHETEGSVLATLRIRGTRLAGVEFRDGNVYCTLIETQ